MAVVILLSEFQVKYMFLSIVKIIANTILLQIFLDTFYCNSIYYDIM